MQENRRSGKNWIGWVIFVLVIFGSRILPPIANWLTQTTGLSISPPVLIAGLVGLSVLISIASSFVQQGRQTGQPMPTRLPTTQQPSMPTRPISQSRLPGQQSSPTPSNLPRLNLPSGEQRLPGAPRFEPIINPRVLTFGIIGMVLLGGSFFLLLLLTGNL